MVGSPIGNRALETVDRRLATGGGQFTVWGGILLLVAASAYAAERETFLLVPLGYLFAASLYLGKRSSFAWIDGMFPDQPPRRGRKPGRKPDYMPMIRRAKLVAAAAAATGMSGVAGTVCGLAASSPVVSTVSAAITATSVPVLLATFRVGVKANAAT